MYISIYVQVKRRLAQNREAARKSRLRKKVKKKRKKKKHLCNNFIAGIYTAH